MQADQKNFSFGGDSRTVQSGPIASPSEQNRGASRHGFSIAPLIVLSVIFGMLGGGLTSSYLFRGGFFAAPQGEQPLSQISVTEDSALISAVEKATPAVVSIVVSRDLSQIPGYGSGPFGFDPFNFFFSDRQPGQPDFQQVGAGSGFFVSPDGLIMTNKHVVGDRQASYTVITSDGKSYQGQVAAVDPVNDLALVKISAQGMPFLDFAESEQLKIGQRVIAIGNSLGQYKNTVTSGIVSGIGRSIIAGGSEGSEQLSGVIQTDAAINPGNSGGPLLNLSAQVVGVNTAVDRQGQLVGFAIPASDAAMALSSYRKTGGISRPFLGVRYVMISPALAAEQRLGVDYGAWLVSGGPGQPAVLPDSPADRAGLREGDIILEVGGRPADAENTLASLLKNYDVGQEVELKVLREGRELLRPVQLAEAK